MEFPQVWDSQEWKVIERQKEFWVNGANGVQRLLGVQTLYKSLKRQNEAIREMNIYWRGAVGRIWYKLIDGQLIVVTSQILKDGQWLTGLPGAEIKISVIIEDNKYLGARLLLQTERDGVLTSTSIYRDRKRR